MNAPMPDRRAVLRGALAVAAAGGISLSQAEAQQVPYSVGTEPPKTRAPANATDCHFHIYDASFPIAPYATLKPPPASVQDYQALQRRIGTTRCVVVLPSTYGTDNSHYRRPAAATRRQGSRTHGGRGEPVRHRSGTAPDARCGRARHPLQSVAAGRHHARHDRAAGEADRADGLALPDQRAGGPDRRGAGDLPARAGTAGVRPPGACAGCGQPELPVDPAPDRQGQHVGEAVRRL